MPFFHFRRRYNLPPSDPRFIDLTPEEILVDNWAHAHFENPKLRDEVDPHYDEEVDEMMAQIEASSAAAPPPDSDDWEVVEDLTPDSET